MKNVLHNKTGAFILAILSILLFASFASLKAATPVTAAQVSTPFDLESVFVTIAALSGAVLLLTSVFKRLVKTADVVTIIVSSALSLLISWLGLLLQVGIFVGVAWYYVFIYGLSAMLIANGLSTWPVISSFLTLLKLKVPAQ